MDSYGDSHFNFVFFRSCSPLLSCNLLRMASNAFQYTLFLSILDGAAKEKTSRFLACLALVPTTLPLILLTLSARHNFQTAGISLGT